jgi:hypothetical protein
MSLEMSDADIERVLLRLRMELFAAAQILKGEQLGQLRDLVRDVAQCLDYGAVRSDLRSDLRTIVFEALGEASMCWREVSKAGVFESGRAVALGDRVLDQITNALLERGVLDALP